MKLKQRPMLILALAITLLLVLEFVYYMYVNNREEPIRQVSLIVYGSDTSRWENLRQGAELAAEDMNAEVTLITMSTEDDALEQISLIEREIENGADALLIAACDSEAVGSYMKHTDLKIPYVFVESGTEEAGLIAADDARMADSLARTIDENEKDWIKVALVADHTERDSVRRRLEGMLNPEVVYANEIVLWERNDQEKNKKAQFFLQRELTEEAVDVVVALDNSSMEELLDATVNLNKDIKIYGIASSNKSVYYLDNRLIKSLVYQDEFSVGYLGLKELLSDGTTDGNAQINYEVVAHDELYEPANQKLLFPHVR